MSINENTNGNEEYGLAVGKRDESNAALNAMNQINWPFHVEHIGVVIHIGNLAP